MEWKTVKRLTYKAGTKIYTEYLQGIGVKESSIVGIMSNFRVFITYLRDREIKDFRSVTPIILRDYSTVLLESINKKTGKPYSSSIKIHRFSVVKQFYKFLYGSELILCNPAEDVVFNIAKKSKIREVFGKDEIATFLDKIDLKDTCGLRDRTIFELMYSSGLRVSEVADLKIKDIDFSSRMLMVRNGKWGKDRVVPISIVASKFLQKYLVGRRNKKESSVFLGTRGSLKGASITERFNTRMKRYKMNRPGLVTHSIRHSVATHLLESGAGIRYVQALLGHESIETTVRYTHMLYDNMKKIYKSYHPRENEYYKEVDSNYLLELEEFRDRLNYK